MLLCLVEANPPLSQFLETLQDDLQEALPHRRRGKGLRKRVVENHEVGRKE